MKVHELVARCVKAAEGVDPMRAVREVLDGLRGEVTEIERMLAYIPGTGGNHRQVFYRSPDLTLPKVCFPSGRRTPPQDHGTWAAILVLSGEEKNTLYRRENGALRKASEVTLTRGSILIRESSGTSSNTWGCGRRSPPSAVRPWIPSVGPGMSACH